MKDYSKLVHLIIFKKRNNTQKLLTQTMQFESLTFSFYIVYLVLSGSTNYPLIQII